MKKIYLFFCGAFLALVLAPVAVHAQTAELVSITNNAEDLSELVPSGDAPDEARVFLFGGEYGQEYTAVFSTDEEPVGILGMGSDLTNSWGYDAATGLVTVTFTAVEIVGMDGPPDADLFIIVLVYPVAQGEDGPPAEAAGMWMSTNVTQWEMLPPQPGSPQFGFKLTGPAGTAGFFNMFLPDSLIELLSTMEGTPLAIEDLAVFMDDDQASMSISEVEGGALIEINVTFTDDTIMVSRATSAYTRSASTSTLAAANVLSILKQSSDSNVTKEIVAKKKLNISLAANKYSIAKNKKVQLFGWLASGQKNKKVALYAKTSADTSYAKVASATTTKNGRFVFNVAPAKSTTYKVKYNKKFSPTKEVTVTK